MIALVVLLWCVYLSDCFVRQQQGHWTIRAGVRRRFRAIDGPDLQLLGNRFGFAWTPLLPWRAAYSVSGSDLAVKAVQQRFAAIARHTRWSIVASACLFAWVMVVLPLLVVADVFAPVALPWIVAGVAAWIFGLTQFFVAYRRTYDSRPPLETWLTMTLSPVSLMRAPIAVAFEAAVTCHPVAAAAALCDDGEFLRIARLWWFDDEEGRSKVEQIARERGLLARLSAAPEAWEAGAAKFCPRCHETYTAGAHHCSDCDEVELEPLAS
jgi:hypothetical protein